MHTDYGGEKGRGRGVRPGTKRGKYNTAQVVSGSYIVANSSAGLTNPDLAKDIVFKEVKKVMLESAAVQKANKYFNDITKNWSTHGSDRSRVTFKVKVRRSKTDTGLDIILKMKGTKNGISRFHMVDSEGRQGGKKISVEGQTIEKQFVQQAYYKNKDGETVYNYGFTAEGNVFDLKYSVKGTKRKRRVTKKQMERLGVTFPEPMIPNRYGQLVENPDFTRRVQRKVKKVMPMREYDRFTRGPNVGQGTGEYKKPTESKYPTAYSDRVYQGDVEPKGYTKEFIRKYIVGSGPSSFRKDTRNAARRAIRKVLKSPKRKTTKKNKSSSKKPYKGKGNYVGRATRTASKT